MKVLMFSLDNFFLLQIEIAVITRDIKFACLVGKVFLKKIILQTTHFSWIDLAATVMCESSVSGSISGASEICSTCHKQVCTSKIN